MKYPNTLTYLFFICFVTISANSILAQDHMECGTKVTPESLKYFDSIKERVFELEAEILANSANRNNSNLLNSIPIKAHIIRPSSGIGGLSETELNDAIDIMNNYYANAGMEFFLCDGINYINDDDLYSFETNEESGMTSVHGIDDIINIYFTNTITSSSSGSALCGYASFPGGPERILMANGCTTNGSTLSHEMGHFFALYHTHGTSNSTLTDELVNGSNCSTAGDRICDTPADPQLGGSNVDSGCNYTGTAVDATQTLFSPNPRNIMSYSLKACRTEFSQQQYARISAVYQVSRTNLECSSFNANFFADNTQSCGTTLTANFIGDTEGATSWSWDIDGDGNEDYNVQNPTHTYTSAGLYDVALTVSNGTQSINRILNDYIEVGAKETSTSQINLSLTLDDWPAETSWQFLDENGGVLYSGGPYLEGTDDFTIINETFDIDPNLCYSFVIDDSYGDGICCFSGNGQYELRALDNTLLARGGDFGSGEQKNFFSGILNTSEFNFDDFRLYPNPAASHITIKNSNYQLPDAYTIYSTLGQVISHKKVSLESDLNINIENIDNGIYFMKLEKDKTSKVLTFIKN